MSNCSGVKALPNSADNRSASCTFRTLPKTWTPFCTRTFVVPQPIPVETPVTTTLRTFLLLLDEFSSCHGNNISSDRDGGLPAFIFRPKEKERRASDLIALFAPDIDRIRTEVAMPNQVSGKTAIPTS